MQKLMFPLSAPAFLAACLLTAPVLRAQTKPATIPTTNLPPIIVQASRTGRTADEIASGTTVITSDQIQRSGVSDTVQALEKLGGLYFRRISGDPSQSEVVMRGFSQNAHGRVLVLVDGQRLNEPDMATPNWSRIPVQSIDRIEVLHGGQTALYGNYAVAGVINIITKKGADPITSVSVTVGSEDTFGTHIHKSGMLDEATRYAADVDWQKSQGWRANSQYETYDVRANVEHNWTERFSSSLGSFYNWGTYGMPGPLTKQQMRDNPRQSKYLKDQASNEAWGGNFGSRGETPDWGELSFNLLGQRRLRNAEFLSWGNNNDYRIDSIAFAPKYQLDKEIGGHRNLFTLGTDWGIDRLNFLKTPLPAGAPLSDVQLDRLDGALYARDEFFFSDRLSLALGARREAMRTAIAGTAGGVSLDDSSTDWQSAFDAALLFRPEKGQKCFLRASTLYRYPFLDEVASYQGWGSGFDPNLNPEKGWQIEAGLSVEISRELVYDLRIYQLNMTDEIAPDPITFANKNLDETRRNGFETGLRWSPEKWGSIGLNYQLIDAEFSAGANKGKIIPLVPTHVVTLDGELKTGKGVSLLGAMRAVSPQFLGDDTDNNSDRIPSYMVFDAGVRYEPAFLDGFSLIFACDNVFDKSYATTGFEWLNSLYPANGRMWKLNASYTF
jgi:iron complex outermembrane receptor protein